MSVTCFATFEAQNRWMVVVVVLLVVVGRDFVAILGCLYCCQGFDFLGGVVAAAVVVG